MFVCEFLKQPSVFSFEQIGLAELLTCYLPNSWSILDMFGCQVGWGQPTCRIPDKPRWDQCKGGPTGPTGPTGPPSITGVYLVSLVISLCVEKTIRNHEDMTTHSKPFKNGWSDLNIFQIFSNYFNNIGLQCTQGTLGLVNACVRAGRRRCCVSSGSSKENGTE